MNLTNGRIHTTALAADFARVGIEGESVAVEPEFSFLPGLGRS